jgi:hypothetical protein
MWNIEARFDLICGFRAPNPSPQRAANHEHREFRAKRAMQTRDFSCITATTRRIMKLLHDDLNRQEGNLIAICELLCILTYLQSLTFNMFFLFVVVIRERQICDLVDLHLAPCRSPVPPREILPRDGLKGKGFSMLGCRTDKYSWIYTLPTYRIPHSARN